MAVFSNASEEMAGRARARPIRAAFLIEEGEYTDLVLDGIFADCYNRWGGRFSPIVLCQGRQVPEEFWPWLEAYDPDLIYSYFPLTREVILEIHERLNPAKVFVHWVDGQKPRLDSFGFKPNWDFDPLSSLSVVFRLSRQQPLFRAPSGPLSIFEMISGEPSRVFADNFGIHFRSRGTGLFPPDAGSVAQLLTICSPASRQQGDPGPYVDDELAAMSEFALGRAQSLSLLSLVEAPKLEIPSGDWSGSFNLVVGDHFQDRLLFWNARLLIPGWLDSELCAFRVTLAQLRSPTFTSVLTELLRRRNHVNGGSGGQSVTCLRSVSLTSDELSEAENIVGALGIYGHVRSVKLESYSSARPDPEVLDRAQESLQFGRGYSSKASWQRFRWTGESATPPPSEPDHLSDSPPNQAFSKGYWATDYIIQSRGEGGRLGGENEWRLPKRWRMASAFSFNYVRDDHFQRAPNARRSRDGLLCLFVNRERPVDRITVPTVESAVYHALTHESWVEDNLARGQAHPSPKVARAFPSNEARYLTGVIGMAGGLDAARSYFLHPFLSQFFASLGGTPNLPSEKVSLAISDLRKRARGRTAAFDLHDDQELAAFASMVLKAARSLKRPKGYVRLAKLKADWEAYRQQYWATHRVPAHSDEIDWDKEEALSLDRCFADLRRKKVVFQGYESPCPTCHHRNWINFDELSSEPACAICRTVTTTPLEIGWSFRANEFLIESLRDRSVLSVLWTLSELSGQARRSFMYVGPTGFIFSKEHETLDAEADLIALVDGEVVLCEVKSSWSHLRASDIHKLVALAKKLRSDRAILAVMDDQPVLANEIAEAENELNAVGIRFSVMRYRSSAENYHSPNLD